MLNVLLQYNFATNGRFWWDAPPGEEIIDLRRDRAILRLKCLRNIAPDPDERNDDELSAVCCFKLLRSNRGTRVEVTPNDVRWSYLARKRGNGAYVVVGDVTVWMTEELPDKWELERE